MATIAKTKKFQELEKRHENLVHLYATMSELRLHTNRAVDEEVAKIYLEQVINAYPRFFVPALESMRKYFYISLHSYIGAYLDIESNVKLGKNNKHSLASYLYDGKRKDRKKRAIVEFEKLLRDDADSIGLLFTLRNSLGHYDAANVTNELHIFSEADTIKLLNGLGRVLYYLGYQKQNSPYGFSYDNDDAKEVYRVIDALFYNKDKTEEIRESYIVKREMWINK